MARIWWGDRLIDQFVLGSGEPAPSVGGGLRSELINDVPVRLAPRGVRAWRELLVPLLLCACVLGAVFTPLIPWTWAPAELGGATFRAGTIELPGRRVHPQAAPLRRRAVPERPVEAASDGFHAAAPPANHQRMPTLSGTTFGIRGIGTTARDGRVGPFGRVPSITVSEPIIDAPLTPEMIRRVILAHKGELTECYDSALATDASLSGPHALKFTIGPDGATRDIEVPGPLEACLSRHLRTWTFPRPRGGGSVVVSFPFNLTLTPTLSLSGEGARGG